MAFDGTLLNRPSDGSERRISTALMFLYRGVFVPEPPATGVAERRRRRRVARPRVPARPPVDGHRDAHAPGGGAPAATTAERGPGTYPVAAAGRADRPRRRSGDGGCRGGRHVEARGEGGRRARQRVVEHPDVRRRRHARLPPCAAPGERPARRARDRDRLEAVPARTRRRHGARRRQGASFVASSARRPRSRASRSSPGTASATNGRRLAGQVRREGRRHEQPRRLGADHADRPAQGRRAARVAFRRDARRASVLSGITDAITERDRRPRPVRGLPPDARRRRVPGGERGRDGLRGRGRGRRLRRAVGDAVRPRVRQRALRLRRDGRSRGRSAT